MSEAASLLARWRVTLGFLFGAAAFWLSQPTWSTLFAGSLIAAVGEAIRIWASGHLQKSREVTTSGPYRWTAHPLYVGSSIMGLGLALAAGSVIVAIMVAVYLGVTVTAAMKSEEAFLRKTFGDEYDRYRHGRLATRTNPRRFSLTRALANHEHRAVVGLLLAILLLALKAAANV